MIEYRVKVSGKKFLWGNASLKCDLTSPLVLTIVNDAEGDDCEVGFLTGGAGEDVAVGRLSPGEVVSVPLVGTKAVYATTQTGGFSDTWVRCVLAACPGPAAARLSNQTQS